MNPLNIAGVGSGIKRLDELRGEIKEDSLFEGVDLDALIKAIMEGNQGGLEETMLRFNRRHSGIHDKAAVVGAAIGEAMLK